MRFFVLPLALLLLFAVLGLTETPHNHVGADGLIGWPPIHCGKPCVIEEDHGGIIFLYSAEAEQMKVDKTPVIIDGPCISACTIFADIDRANVCVTTNAVFGIHQAAFGDIYSDVVYEDPKLNAYVKAHGGEPSPDSGNLLMVPFGDLVQFYKPCPGAA